MLDYILTYPIEHSEGLSLMSDVNTVIVKVRHQPCV